MKTAKINKALRRSWWIIAVVAFVAVAAATAYCARRDNMRQANSRIRILPRQETADIDGGFSSDNLRTAAPGSNINTYVELLRSDTIIERTAELAGMTAGDVDDLELRISVVKDSRVIDITVLSPESRFAINFANLLPKTFFEYTMEKERAQAEADKKYLEDQVRKAEKELKEAEDTLREFKKNNRMKDLSSETGRMVGELMQFETDLQEARVDLESTRSKIREVQQQLSESDQERLAQRTVTSNPIAGELNGRLAELEIEYARLSQLYSDIHPEVLSVSAQIEEIKKQLRGLEMKIISQDVTAPNPQYQALLQSLGALKADEMALQTKVDSLKSVTRNLERELKDLPEAEHSLVRMMRRQNLAEKLYLALHDRRQKLKVFGREPAPPGEILKTAASSENITRKYNFMLLGAALAAGLALGLAAAYARESISDTIESPDELRDATGLESLAQIPYDESMKDNGPVCVSKPNTPVAESYRALRSRLKVILEENNANSFLVTSGIVREGKSSTALNLAVTFAQLGKKVVLVDGDLRRPTIHKRFELENRGITNVYIDKLDVSQVIVESATANLSILPAGPLVLTEDTPLISSEVFESDVVRSMIDMLKVSYDIVIIDTPPVLAVADVMVIAPLVEGILFVANAGDVPRREIVSAAKTLASAGAPLLGAVLNGTKLSHSYYRHLYYYYDNRNHKRR